MGEWCPLGRATPFGAGAESQVGPLLGRPGVCTSSSRRRRPSDSRSIQQNGPTYVTWGRSAVVLG